MPELGRKYTCYSCHTKFYDLGKPDPLCPKCGADQRDADDTPVVTSHRSRRVVEEPVEEPEFPEGETPAATGDEEDEEIVVEREEEPDDDDDEDEEF